MGGTLEALLREVLGALGRAGVEKVEALGRDFDAKKMEAIQARAAVEGGVEEGKVCEEFLAGFVVGNDCVVRPSLVAVVVAS